MNRALFLDRDGTIVEDRGYMRDPASLKLLPGAAEALRSLAALGWRLIVVSNQSGVGRGLISPGEKDAVQARFLEIMRAAGVPIAASYICEHSPADPCACRKPSPYFLELAAREFALDLSRCWMVGDRAGDIVCGRNAGCSTVWLRNTLFPSEEEHPTLIASNWREIFQNLAALDR